MLKWNEKNKNIAVWGQDADGVYLRINEALLHKNWAGSDEIANPVFDLQFKPDTQYVLSVEWKLAAVQNYDGLAFRIFYTDGTTEWHGLAGTIITKTIARLITKAGKTVQKISASYGSSKANTLIYNISLIEGNKPLQGFPVAEEDQTGANNVNLADGTKEFTIGVGSTNYTYKGLYVSKIKPNTVYYVNAGNIQNLVGNPDRYSFVLYNKDVSTVLCPTLNADKNGGFLITYNNFTEQEGRLLCYAGIAGSTLGNSVKFTEVMLVEGFLPAPVWTPSFSEQQAEIKTITKTLTEIKAENGEISLRVNEVSERVEEAKQEAIDTAKEYTTIQTYRETEIDLRAEKWDQDTYYPVTIKIPTYETMIEVTAMWAASKPEWAAHENGYFSMNCVWRSNGSLWGAFTIKRIIEVFEWKFTKEIPDTTPVQYILPAGSIGQLISSSEEFIYLRGGGRYLFKIGNNCVAVVHDSRYTAPDGTTVAPSASVIRPVLTNVMKTEFDSRITQLKDSIDLRVTKTDYNNDQQIVNKDISDLQINYNQISSTVSKIINGTQEISGVVTQSNFVTIFSSNKNALGQEVIESINVGGGGVTIDASRINLNGAISANGNVQITTDGKLIAVNGEFTGKITATEGRFGNLKISGNKFVAESGSGIEFSSPGSGYTRINTIGTNISIKNDSGVCLALDGRGKGGSNTACLNIINDEYGKAINSTGSAEFILKTGGSILFMSESSRLYNIQILSDRTTFEKPVYFKNLTEAPSSNYYLCIDIKTKQLYYR